MLKALRALQGPTVRPSRRSLQQALRDGLRASPGSRASLLALELGVDVAEVAAALEGLEQRCEVVRAGMGWQLVDGPRPRR